MIDLPETSELTVDRTAVLRRQLMDTMLADPPKPARATTPPTRGLLVAAVLVFVLVVAGLAAAVAITVTATHRGSSDSVVVDSDTLDVLYQGRRITQDDLVELTRAGKGTFTTTDADTEHDLHATRAFDTLEELDAYSADYLAWQKSKADGADVDAWGTLRP
ncbi:hypothetical protein ACPPVS_01070 [Cellulomonas sp. McL0617]|uniref:hypothetical protein n=1 Tax=Cellulomonas sp. McL0617 TaxID=3415675 RepID=UPI003CE9E7A6